VVFALLALFALVHANKCCIKPSTLEEAYAHSEVIFTAEVLSTQVSYAGGSATLTLKPTQLHKGNIRNFEHNVYAKYSCTELPVEIGQSAVFFGKISQSSGTFVAVDLQVCDPNGPTSDFSTCEYNQLGSGTFDSCNTQEPIPDVIRGDCDCSEGTTTFSRGTFGCDQCTCASRFIGTEERCVLSCKVGSACVLAPSIIGSTLLVVVFVCIMVALRRRRKAMESVEVEMADVSEPDYNATNYAYQPVMTSPSMGQQQVMITAQGPVVLNKHPI
jgi:hypothetical protein